MQPFVPGSTCPGAIERRPRGLPRPSSYSSSQVIDLTLEDDADEENERIERPIAHESVAFESATTSDSVVHNSSGLHESTTKTTGEAISKMTIPVPEDVESDVDEEWPHVLANEPLVAKTRVSCCETEGPLTTPDPVGSLESLEDGEIFQEGVSLKPIMPICTLDHPKTGAGGRKGAAEKDVRPHLRSKKQKKRGKKKTKRKLEAMQMMQASPGHMYPVYERTMRQRPLAAAPPPGEVTFAMMRNGPRGEPMHVRPVFQEAPPALFHASEHRVGVPHVPIRPPPPQRPAHPLPPQQRPAHPLPPQQRPAHPLPPQQRLARPLPPQQRLTRPLPPPYEDSQILRVNRQGSMEMINGEANLSFCSITSGPPTYGGFKYRSVSVFSPPPVSNGSGFPLQHLTCDSSRLPSVLTSSGGISTNSVASTGHDEFGDVDLDSLRVAALRTKMKRSLKQMEQTTETVTAVQSFSSTSESFAKPVRWKEKQTKATSPEIDTLRSDILRSMTKNRNRTTNSKALNVSPPILQSIEANAIEKSDESEMNKASKSNTLAAEGNSSALKDSSEFTVTQMSVRANGIGNGGPLSETDKSSIASEQNQVISQTASQLAMYSEKAKPIATITASTPEFRPLTASSQSLVIQLGPEDFLPRNSKGDVTMSSGLQDAIKEMRRKIAEREKEQTNRLLASAATELSKPLLSPALSSTSLKSKVSSADTQLFSVIIASPGISSPGFDNVKESSSGSLNVDRLFCAQTEANQVNKGMMKAVLQPPSETLLSVDTAKSAAGQESHLKPALAPQVRSDISRGISTMTITGDVADTRCDSIITETSVLSSEPGFEIDHDFDAIRAEYQQCVTECEEAEVHIAQLSSEMAQLEKQLRPVELTVERP